MHQLLTNAQVHGPKSSIIIHLSVTHHHSSILSLMALKSLHCADVPLSNYSLTPHLMKSYPI